MTKDEKKTDASGVDWPFDYRITAKFREGVKQICMTRAWGIIEGNLNVGTDDRLAEDVHAYRTNISRYRQGRMGAAELFTFLTHLGLDCGDLDPLPTLAQRAMVGYQVAIHFIREGNVHPKEEERISDEMFAAMRILHSTERYKAGMADGRWDWEALARDVEDVMTVQELSTPFSGGDELAELHEKWMLPVCECLAGIPYKWL